MANLLSMFNSLIPSTPLTVGQIVASGGDTHQVTLIDGSKVVAMGKGQVGDLVFMRGGTIQGTAPSLTLENIEI